MSTPQEIRSVYYSEIRYPVDLSRNCKSYSRRRKKQPLKFRRAIERLHKVEMLRVHRVGIDDMRH